MADGEKKRFNNFAEFAKARQGPPGKEMALQGPGGPSESRFMQQGGMNMMGGQPTGGMPTAQGLQQQRGMGGMGGPGMGSMGGMHSMGAQLGGRALGIQATSMQGTNLSALGMGGRAPTQNFGFSPRGGAPGGLQGGGAPGFHPGGGYDGAPSAAFDPSDFPVLGRGGGQGQLGFDGGDVVGSAALGQQKEFSMEEDFPALPGAPGGGQAPNNSLMTGGAGAPGMVEQFQRMKLENFDDAQGGNGGQGLAAPAGGQDKYGMLGLLSVIRMNNENVTLLALGCDLTQLAQKGGVHAAAVLLHFASGAQDGRNPRKAFFQKFTDMTLFYLYYHFLTRPTDQPHQQLRESLVQFAFKELAQRGWQV